MNALEARNLDLYAKVVTVKDDVEKARARSRYVDDSLYPIEQITKLVTSLISEMGYETSPVVDVVDRGRFKADVAVRAPDLLRNPGKEVYFKKIAPDLAEALRKSEIKRYIQNVQTQGIYVNLELSTAYFAEKLFSVTALGADFGKTNAYRGKRIIVEYSDPNAAKKLHAGHIRSTIIGEVIANIMDWNGATTYRWNHPNDLGGFGFLLVGYRRFWSIVPKELAPNDKLAYLYHIRRTLERLVEESKTSDLWSADDKNLVNVCLGNIADIATLKDRVAEYTVESNAAFERLEKGDPQEIKLWAEMIEWSWADFEPLYSTLNVKFDVTLGESFYSARGIELVAKMVSAGLAVVFTQELARHQLDLLEAEKIAEKISENEFITLKDNIAKDVGATVVMLPHFRRVVVLRSDGRTIYTTRDLGMIQFRQEVFDPYRVIYEVGQEQKDHFQDLFEAARQLKIVGDTPRLDHVYHGFYVDARTKKKLSSRDGAGSVTKLLSGTIEYFERKYADTTEFSAEEVKKLARTLGVGSIIINDIRKDIKGNFEIEAVDFEKTFKDFEDSGGAYLIYTACRTKSIIRKYDRPLPQLSELKVETFESVELGLIKKIFELPNFVRAVGDSLNPATLVNYLFDLAQQFNSFYAQCPVLKGGEVHLHRLIIVQAVGLALENGLRVCDIDVPERI